MYKIFSAPLFLGKEVIHLPTCHSTNDIANDLLSRNRPEGALVITDHQTAGRGQRGNSWQAQPGQNLTFSLLFRPTFLPVRQSFGLNLFVSLALRDWALALTNASVLIKWPNDLYVEEKKMGGILIENTVKGAMLQGSVIGIGVNVNQTEFGELAASSLRVCTGQAYNLPSTLEMLLLALEKRYLQLKRNDWKGLWHDYHVGLLGYHKPRKFGDAQGTFEAQIEGVAPDGTLSLRRTDGILNTYQHGEVQWFF